MILSAALPLLFFSPFAAADGVHRMKLKKLPTLPHEDNSLAISQLARKYGAQVPLAGAGGLGRKFASDNLVNKDRKPGSEDLYWTQSKQEINGGHSLPLNSMSSLCYPCLCLTVSFRLHERSVLC